jgi:energy-coupling factor transport system substrate-specific component
VRLLVASLAGAALFLWPFLGGDLPAATPALALALAVVAALALVEAGTRRLDARGLALLSAIAAVDSALRLAVVTGIGGFSPVFFPILCAGFALGPSFGFLAGALSLLVSALVTGGVGPWLPYQLFAAGWVGALAGLAGLAIGRRTGRAGIAVLAAAGFVLGLAFGAAMDVWDWTTFYRDAPVYGWRPGLAAAEAARRFGEFYLATSLAYDLFRAVGNAVLVALFAAPVVAALARVRARLGFEIVPESRLDSGAA